MLSTGYKIERGTAGDVRDGGAVEVRTGAWVAPRKPAGVVERTPPYNFDFKMAPSSSWSGHSLFMAGTMEFESPRGCQMTRQEFSFTRLLGLCEADVRLVRVRWFDSNLASGIDNNMVMQTAIGFG